MEKITFFGTRGSSSLTASKYMEFGGATTCILFNLDHTHIVLDCGTGINNALDSLKEVDELHLLISHCHIDHIGAIPTLLSAFDSKKIHIWGKTYNGISIKDSISRIMSQSLWPVRADTYKNVEFHEIDGDFVIGNVSIKTMDSNHPGGCTLFRFDTKEDSIVTAFDFCHLNGYDEKLCNFAKGAQVLIYDGCMNETQLLEKPDWGHSTPEAGARIGTAIGAQQILITHFGSFDDTTLSNWEKELRNNYPNLFFARSGQRPDELKKIVDIGALLASEKDNDTLLTKIVESCMDITNADGGTLYLLENNNLEFKVLINRSKKTKFIRKNSSINIPSVSIDGKNACATSAREKKLINIPDCYSEQEYDFSGAKEYDRFNDYLTKSVLVIPMIDEYDDVVGVLQLINSQNATGEIVTFNKTDEEVLLAIANQASMAIVNSSYSQKIDELLYDFVKVMSVGIDERTPYNANHTRNMVRFADSFFEYEKNERGPYLVDDKKRREILMSIWLHDIGKILTPMDIMNKDSRLGDAINIVYNRFERRELLLKLYFDQGKISKEEYDILEIKRKDQLDKVNRINKAGFLSEELKHDLEDLESQTYKELDGTIMPILTKEELYQLSIVKGTLNKEERSVMEGHVSMTQKFLSQLHFPKYYDQIPVYAGNHHEMLNGSGYPNHLTAKDLPWPCRLITVCDIFEALTAKDRPYKKPFPPEKAFAILLDMADQGQLDRNVVLEFQKSCCWVENN